MLYILKSPAKYAGDFLLSEFKANITITITQWSKSDSCHNDGSNN